MNEMRKWWPGLILVAVLWIVAAWRTMPQVEADLVAQAQAALKDTILDKVKLEAAGRDVTFSAQAFSATGRESAVGIVRSVPGIRRVHDLAQLVAEAKPYQWSAKRELTRVVLEGFVPLPATRTKLAEGARAIMNGGEVADQMAFGRGAPTRFDAAALIGLDQLNRLKEGSVRIEDMRLWISGMARETGAREAIAAALKSLPEGFSVAENKVAAPPYVFHAYKDPVAGTITLSGFVPDQAAKTAIVQAVAHKFFNERLVDQLKISAGAPSGFARAAIYTLSELSRLNSGTGELSDTQVKVNGDALHEAAAAQIRASFERGAPQGYKAQGEIAIKPLASAVDPIVCQQLFREMLGKATIQFESGSAAINADSNGLIDKLTEIALRCPTSRIEIAGHTDADGDAQANKALSERRAKAVADVLVRNGLPADRFKAEGYGSSQPIASNDTDDGKAQNRRIEFLIR